MKTNENLLVGVVMGSFLPSPKKTELIDVIRNTVVQLETQQKRIEELEAGHRWIPVTERLPEKMKDVLVIRMHGEPDIEFLFYDGTWVGDTEGKQDVTHWMPLPKPPKGE